MGRKHRKHTHTHTKFDFFTVDRGRNNGRILVARKIKARTAERRWMRNPVRPSSCVTPAGTSNELDVQNEWEENPHTHTSRDHTGEKSHRTFRPPSFCGFSHSFPSSTVKSIFLRTNDSPLVGHFYFLFFLMRKIPSPGIELTSQRVSRLRGYL